MNNLSYWLARIYYNVIGQSVNVIPTGFADFYWAERIYRHIAGFPDNLSGGKSASFWIELWFYHRTGQTHRLAIGTRPAWFWLSKLYASYVGLSTEGILQPASDAFWAEKLTGVPGLGGASASAVPVMEVTGNGVTIANGDATPDAADHTAFAATTIGTTVTRTYTILNTGNADLEDIVVTPPAGFTLTDAPAGTIAASGSDTFTIECDADAVQTFTGTVSIASNDSAAPHTFDISCVVTLPNVANLYLDYDYELGTYQSAGGAAAGVGDPLGQWQDQSGNGRHATQTTSANKPTKQAGGIDFATDDFLNLVDLSALTEGEIFIVLALDEDPPSQVPKSGLWFIGTPSGSAVDTHYPYTDGVIYDQFGTNTRKTTGNPTASLLNTHIYNVTSKANEWTSRINNAQHYTTATNTPAFTATPRLGASPNGRYLNGVVKRVLLYSTAPSAGDRTLIAQYLATKYGVTL